MPSGTESAKKVFEKADVTVLSEAWLHEKRKGNRSSVASTNSSASVASTDNSVIEVSYTNTGGVLSVALVDSGPMSCRKIISVFNC